MLIDEQSLRHSMFYEGILTFIHPCFIFQSIEKES
jgi:hypothetical protein